MRQRPPQRRQCLLLLLPSCLLLLLANSSQAFSVSNNSNQKNVKKNINDDDGDDVLKVTFVTGNTMKAREVESIIDKYCFSSNGGSTASSPSCSMLRLDLHTIAVDLPELQEVDTLAIAKNKALLEAQLANGPCLVEDTSLCFHALGGMPGPYIKWFQDTLHSEGLYNILAAYEDKSATAVCSLAYSPAPHADPVLFTGECQGTIVPPARGGGGFGWDTIFVPHSSTVPFSQMDMASKNELSHRGAAVRQWAEWMGTNRNVLLERQRGNNKTTLGHQGLQFSLRPRGGT